MQINIMYFASLRDSTNKSIETITTTAKTVDELYDFLDQQYSFSIDKKNLRVAVNEEYKDFKYQLSNLDTIVFIPPVAGG